MNKGYRRRLNVCQCCIVVRRTRQIFSLQRLGSHTGVEWSLLIGWIGWPRDKKKGDYLNRPMFHWRQVYIWVPSVVWYPILSCLVLSWLVLRSPVLCLYPFEPRFLTYIWVCCRLWELGNKSAFALILLGFWDRTLLAVCELPFPCCMRLWTDPLLLIETLIV